MSQDLNQQPARVAARPAGVLQRLLRRLNAGLHPDQVADLALQALVQLDQEIDRAPRSLVDRRQEAAQLRSGLAVRNVRAKIVFEVGLVAERKCLGGWLEKKIERVIDRHLDHQANGQQQLLRLFGKDQPGQVVGERILLPVDEVALGRNVQRIGQHASAAVRRRAQSHDLG